MSHDGAYANDGGSGHCTKNDFGVISSFQLVFLWAVAYGYGGLWWAVVDCVPRHKVPKYFKSIAPKDTEPTPVFSVLATAPQAEYIEAATYTYSQRELKSFATRIGTGRRSLSK